MGDVGYTTPHDKSYEDELIEYCLIEESYEVPISWFEFFQKGIIVSPYRRSTIDLSKVEDIVPYRKNEEEHREPDSYDYRVLCDYIFVIYESSRDICYCYEEYQERCENKGKSVYPWSFDNEYPTHAIGDEIFYRVRFAL